MKSLEGKILEFAYEAHKGQTRKDGKPYITHPMAVQKISLKLMHVYPYTHNIWRFHSPRVVELIISFLAWNHDVPEDVQKYLNNEELIVQEIKKLDTENELFYYSGMDYILETGLKALNKNRFQNYLEFVLAAKANFYSRIIKLADIDHNLSDLTDKKKREKYLLAQYILEN